MEIGIIGKQGAGKTSLAQLIATLNNRELERTSPRKLTLSLEDEDLSFIAQEYGSPKLTYPQLTFIDADNVRGEVLGLRSSDLGLIRQADALLIVIDAFTERPTSELLVSELINSLKELLSKDIATLEESLGGKWAKRERERARLISDSLEKLRRTYQLLDKPELGPEDPMTINEEELKELSSYQLLSLKPKAVLVNISYESLAEGTSPEQFTQSIEKDLGDKLASLDYLRVRELSWLSREPIALDLRLERELLELGEEDRAEFMTSYGLSELLSTRGEGLLKRMLRALGIIRFFTANQREAREYLVLYGTRAIEGAGKIHTDMMKKFVRGEVFNIKDLRELGLRDAEKLRKRKVDRNYILSDGDILYVLFSK